MENENQTAKELREDFYGKKPEKSIFSRVFNILLWIILLSWIGVCLIDFYNTQESKEPLFCIKKETTTYKDGKVDTCTGLGYKIYNYKRSCFNGFEYGPFWFKDRSVDSENCK